MNNAELAEKLRYIRDNWQREDFDTDWLTQAADRLAGVGLASDMIHGAIAILEKTNATSHSGGEASPPEAPRSQ